ncbi:MAG: putative DNA binding domain-containing protein [Ignavibacteriaceae bacterium]|nr:putative DNA binding domain-containing protein [Ignavibacterium sp.]MCC6254009.1 putative DNA binding domain-containing protein [Ignavibacteriaceae bacterium]HRN25060.1 ATP-binding protein [Ignavibacteriaceae bacterium]HRP91754.1 ATP-binding protein [Ignavibacteriaceae bacterium]HRQ52909.1 ATP-binding protein [Ignavibacteriaceae bacterium]
MKIEDLKELIASTGENEWIEFKVNDCNPREIGEYISALSNSACLHNMEFGYLIFGIENSSKAIVGTNFKPKQTKVGNEELENWLATQLKPRNDFSIIELIVNSKTVIVFKIDATIDTPIKFKGEEFIRVGSYKKKLSEFPEKARKIWNKVKAKRFEKEIALGNLDADTVLQLLDYSSLFDLLNQSLPTNKDSILEKLEQEKLISHKLELYNILNLGAILFAKDINKFENISRKAIRVVVYKGSDKIITEKEQLGKKGYANGFEELVDYISNILPSNEEIVKAIREETKLYPILAVRELIANALIHQDFSTTGSSPMIEIFSDRIEITNPGAPLINVLRFIDHNPESRNELLAQFMRRVGVCEERGSGIDKVIFQCEYFQLPPPEFIAGDNFTRVILYSPKRFKEMDRKDKIRACYQHCCLKYVSGSLMSNQSLRDRFNIEGKNYPMISRVISDTLSEGLIKESDPNNKSKKYTKYIPIWA